MGGGAAGGGEVGGGAAGGGLTGGGGAPGGGAGSLGGNAGTSSIGWCFSGASSGFREVLSSAFGGRRVLALTKVVKPERSQPSMPPAIRMASSKPLSFRMRMPARPQSSPLQ